MRAGTMGDGIRHLLVDADGAIWIGYFDEGILGNCGWGNPGPLPLGSAGVVKWSSSFEASKKYEPVDEYWLADCHALNVADDEVWACPYTDFPLIHVRHQTTEVLVANEVDGPGGLVVADDVVAVIGDYQDGSTLLTASLSDLPRTRRSRVAMPDGSSPRAASSCAGKRREPLRRPGLVRL